MPIELRDVTFTYSKETPFARSGLKHINAVIREGEWIVVMGSTGAGKSTLLQHLNGLLKPDLGQVLLDGADIHSSPGALREARRRVGLVFQYPEHQLFGATVFEEVAYGPQNFGQTGDKLAGTVSRALEAVGLDFIKYKDRLPLELSGGEKRRVALAGVLAVNPEFVVFDEPTAGLDHSGKQSLIETVARLNREHGTTVIWVTHEIADVAPLATRLIIINQGKIVIDGPFRETLYNQTITELGLDLPVAVDTAVELERRGRPVCGYPVTTGEILGEITRLLR